MLSESTVYQRILRVGESRGALMQARESVVENAEVRFGILPEEFTQRLAAIDDRKRLSRMHKAAVTAATWQDTLEVE
jgi:hypothetical protein